MKHKEDVSMPQSKRSTPEYRVTHHLEHEPVLDVEVVTDTRTLTLTHTHTHIYTHTFIH